MQVWNKSVTRPASLLIYIFEYVIAGSNYTTVNISFQVDRAMVLSHGQSISGKLLVELQVRKSTADGAGAKKFYNDLTTPLPGWDSQIREIVISKKQVRTPYTYLEERNQ